jgi:hypothetical protein
MTGIVKIFSDNENERIEIRKSSTPPTTLWAAKIDKNTGEVVWSRKIYITQKSLEKDLDGATSRFWRR